MKILSVLPIIVFISLFLNACGSYTTTHVKDFRIYVHSDNEEVRETINVLAIDYNDQFGAEALTIVNSQEEANSHIRFISGLRERENKLGLGQWITITSQEGKDLLPSTSDEKLQRTVLYTMELDFDLENIKEKMASRNDKTSGSWHHLYHLFCHEVGHGLQLGHEDERNSVMYRTIPENSRSNVDYETYFDKARAFFGESI